MIMQGLDWLRGSASVSMGQISTGQTNPEDSKLLYSFSESKMNRIWIELIRFDFELIQLEFELNSRIVGAGLEG